MLTPIVFLAVRGAELLCATGVLFWPTLQRLWPLRVLATARVLLLVRMLRVCVLASLRGGRRPLALALCL